MSNLLCYQESSWLEVYILHFVGVYLFLEKESHYVVLVGLEIEPSGFELTEIHHLPLPLES